MTVSRNPPLLCAVLLDLLGPSSSPSPPAAGLSSIQSARGPWLLSPCGTASRLACTPPICILHHFHESNVIPRRAQPAVASYSKRVRVRVGVPVTADLWDRRERGAVNHDSHAACRSLRIAPCDTTFDEKAPQTGRAAMA